jgi:hypothetical protein
MLDSFNIKITKLVKLPQEVIEAYPEEYGDVTDLVTVVHFDYEASKGGVIATKESMVHTPFVKDADFVAYSELTQENVINWVTGVVGEEQINLVKAELEQEIDSKTPEAPLTLPWE